MGTRTFPAIRGQQGLATAAQLAEHGWSEQAVRHAAHTTWQRPHRGVYAPHRGTLTPAQRLVALYLWAGPHAVLTGRAGLHRWGLPVTYGDVHLLVPATSRARSTGGGLLVRTARAPVPVTPIIGRPVAPPVRCLADAARRQGLRGDELRTLTMRSLQQGRIGVEDVAVELRAGPARVLSGMRQALQDYRAGAYSPPEARLGRLVAADPQLPPMLANPVLERLDGTFIGRPDGYLEAAGLVLQVHSRRHHDGFDETGVDRWVRTVEGDARYTAHGLTVLALTPTSIARHPDRVMAQIRSAVRAHEGRDTSQVRVRVNRPGRAG